MSDITISNSTSKAALVEWAAQNPEGVVKVGETQALYQTEGAKHEPTAPEKRAVDKGQTLEILRNLLLGDKPEAKELERFNQLFEAVPEEAISGKMIADFVAGSAPVDAAEAVTRTLDSFEGYTEFQAVLGEMRTDQRSGAQAIASFRENMQAAMDFIQRVADSGDQDAIEALKTELDAIGMRDEGERQQLESVEQAKLEKTRSAVEDVKTPKLDTLLKLGGNKQTREAFVEAWQEANEVLTQIQGMTVQQKQMLKAFNDPDNTLGRQFRHELKQLAEAITPIKAYVSPQTSAWNDNIPDFKVAVDWDPETSDQHQAGLTLMIDAIAANLKGTPADNPARELFAKLLDNAMPLFFVKAANISTPIAQMKAKLPDFVVDTTAKGIRQSNYTPGDEATASQGIDESNQANFDACRGFAAMERGGIHYFVLRQNPESEMTSADGWQDRFAEAAEKLHGD